MDLFRYLVWIQINALVSEVGSKAFYLLAFFAFLPPKCGLVQANSSNHNKEIESNALMISKATAFANKGGTALPTCVYCGISTLLNKPPVVLFPKNSNESSNPWHLAISRTENVLFSQGEI